jgi:hypothetical protein
MKRSLCVLLALLMLAMAIAGCRIGSQPLAEPVTIKVVATEDFGKELVFDREAVIEHRMSAQDVLAEVTEFETDGSYILEFEGRRGNDQVYWMYYINGLLSKYFAGGYIIRPGDVMLWDFHPWAGAHHGSSAIVGSFPEPFAHGYEGQTRPTTVVYEERFRTAAEQITDGLRELGVTDISHQAWNSLSNDEKGDNNLIIIAGNENPLIMELNEHANPLGMYVYFENGEAWVTNYKFEPEQSYGSGTGVIQACQNFWNPLGTGACQNAVFIVSGVNDEGVNRAVDVLLESIDSIRSGRASAIDYAYGVVIDAEGNIIRTPL